MSMWWVTIHQAQRTGARRFSVLGDYMKKSTKGAIAAVGAAALLLGGAGTLAYWNADAAIGGATINAGELKLTDTDGCAGVSWTLDSAEAGASVAFDPGTMHVVPGDVLTKSCNYTIVADGEHLRATATTAGGSKTSGALGVTSTAAFQVEGATVTEVTEENDGEVLTASWSVTVDAANDNSTQLSAAVLSDYVVTLQQVHN